MPFFGKKTASTPSSSSSSSGSKKKKEEDFMDEDVEGMSEADLDKLLAGGGDDLENDPELMKELAQMQHELNGTKPSSAPTAAPRVKKGPFDLEEAHRRAAAEMHEDADVHVELTEEDMNDPELLSQLSSLTGEKHSSQAPPVESLIEFDPPKKVPAPVAAPRRVETPAKQAAKPMSEEDELLSLIAPPKPAPVAVTPSLLAVADKSDLSIEQKLKASNPALLEKYIQQEKAKALQAKKVGDTASALDLMKGMKRLQGRLDEVNSGAVATPQAKTATPTKTTTALPPAKTATPVAGVKKPAAAAVTSPSPATTSNVTQNSDRSGDLSHNSSFEFLQKALQSQIDACALAATRYLHSGDKDTSMLFQKERKQFSADLEALQSIQASGGPLPKFHSETKIYSYINQLNLQENELELFIGKCVGIPIPSGYTTVDSYMNYEIALPSEEAPQKGYSSVVKNTTDPEFNFSVKILIERSKALVRFFEKKKITLELMHSKGFLRKATTLGVINLELAPLLGKCEYHEMVDLLNEKRKPIGTKLEVILRLRYPISSVEHVQVSEKWFYVDKFDATPEKPEKKPRTEAEKAERAKEKAAAKEAKEVKEVAKEPKPEKPKAVKEEPKAPAPVPVKEPAKVPKATPAPTPAPAPAAAQDDDDDEDPDTVDSIVSNSVLEWEEAQINEKSKAFSSKGKPVPPELTDRLQAVQIKMNMMVFEVQTGKLSMEDYNKQLRNGVAFEKNRALKFKSAGKLEFAKMAMNRMKIMQKEIEENESGQE